MVLRRSAIGILFVISSLFATHVLAQPTLPDITGAIDQGIVVLSWHCQYTGIKGISVLRSRDSISDYEIIGYVKKVDKGMQVFADGHPAAGQNFYKLAIIFKSGVMWRSNHFGIYVSGAQLSSSKDLPANDSLQNLIVTRPAVEKESDHRAIKDKNSVLLTAATTADTSKVSGKCSVSISYTQDASGTDINTHLEDQKQTVVARQKVTITFDDPAMNAPIIRSRFINTDSATGHINMFLPDDVSTHHYTVKFYDQQNHLLFDIPKINTANIILDKRNFQRKGVYKFVLRRDVVELESGYIVVGP
jgi:hypothetical protein